MPTEDKTNCLKQVVCPEKMFREMTLEITEKLKNMTYADAKRALRYVKYDLEHSLILS